MKSGRHCRHHKYSASLSGMAEALGSLIFFPRQKFPWDIHASAPGFVSPNPNILVRTQLEALSGNRDRSHQHRAVEGHHLLATGSEQILDRVTSAVICYKILNLAWVLHDSYRPTTRWRLSQMNTATGLVAYSTVGAIITMFASISL